MTNNDVIPGSEALLRTLTAEGVDTVFGYPGGAIMPVYDSLYCYTSSLRHILTRHEQGAVHAAQGYARACGRTGVVFVTSGPGATNTVTGIADAMIDSTPLLVITGQVSTNLLGTDAFQEIDFIGITSAITKWGFQIRRPEEVPWAVSRALYIASTGRPGPVVLDFTRDAQVQSAPFILDPCRHISTYRPYPSPPQEQIEEAARMINEAERPFVVFGQGVVLSGAEGELSSLLSKGDIPAGSTLLGLSALPSSDPHYRGMLGMHGNLTPNVMTNRCDLLIAIGMRFDDRVTGKVAGYAPDAKVIHIDIDRAEIGKIIVPDLGINSDAKEALGRLLPLVERKSRHEWNRAFDSVDQIENDVVIGAELSPSEGPIMMGEAVDAVMKECGDDTVVVTDVGQNQMVAARYSRFRRSRSMITSGGLGTMGFGLPAAIGAKIGCPWRPVTLFVGDGGLQMTLQEFGTIMQEGLAVKMVLLNNSWLGNVRQWQELFPPLLFHPARESRFQLHLQGLRHNIQGRGQKGGPSRGCP